MAFVLIEGYMCKRCGYRWGSRTGTGFRAKPHPKNCPKCKSPYWNKPRTNNIPPERHAAPWNREQTQTRPQPLDPADAGQTAAPERKPRRRKQNHRLPAPG